MSYLGNAKIGKMFLGSTEIGKAYLGNNLVFDKGGEPAPGQTIKTNYLIYGSPTIDGNSYIPNLSSKGFIYTDEPFAPAAGSSWIIQTRLKLNSSNAWRDIWATVDSTGAFVRKFTTQFNTYDSNKRYVFYLSSNGTGWNVLNAKCPGQMQPNVWYKFQLVCTYTGAGYQFKQGYPDRDSWTSVSNVSSYVPINCHVAFGGGAGGTCIDAEFDLSETKIFIDGSLWWEAITDLTSN